MIWNRYLMGVANNPQMTKKEVCQHLDLKVGTINSIQKDYKLQSRFYFKKPKAHKKKKTEERTEPPKSKKTSKNKGIKGGCDTSVSEEELDKYSKSFDERYK